MINPIPRCARRRGQVRAETRSQVDGNATEPSRAQHSKTIRHIIHVVPSGAENFGNITIRNAAFKTTCVRNWSRTDPCVPVRISRVSEINAWRQEKRRARTKVNLENKTQSFLLKAPEREREREKEKESCPFALALHSRPPPLILSQLSLSLCLCSLYTVQVHLCLGPNVWKCPHKQGLFKSASNLLMSTGFSFRV